MEMTGAEAILACLKAEQVPVVFGYPGGAVLSLYDALYRMKFPHILTGHEQGAVHAADGYARATGQVGVCFATSGPGVCNMVTGIATANMDSIPLVVISGQVATPLIGRDSFQEADISGITTPITKHNYLVEESPGSAPGTEGSLLHRPERPSRASAGGRGQGHVRHPPLTTSIRKP